MSEPQTEREREISDDPGFLDAIAQWRWCARYALEARVNRTKARLETRGWPGWKSELDELGLMEDKLSSLVGYS